ncbi:MAG: MotA/TolQ/ExbB proton channel family protein [Planctomycetia bacterium]|nr:MotA/TolQ/ExbB proton channel family protein [Planctomycetia bacterium]
MSRWTNYRRGALLLMCALLCGALLAPGVCTAADPPPAPAPTGTAPPASTPATTSNSEVEKALQPAASSADGAKRRGAVPDMKVLDLIVSGGRIMYVIGLMGVVAITFFIERLIGLRRGKILPRRLNRELTNMARRATELDPRDVNKVCLKYRCAASTVIRTMLSKVGRPASEIESAVTAARDREGTQLFNNVRWLYLAVSVAPMLGLLGTVWGMIEIFHQTANSAAVQGNKTQQLAGGIYVALVATFGGLAVAIPSAFAAHFFESRIQGLFHQIDGLILTLQPLVERYEARSGGRHKSDDGDHSIGAPRPDVKSTKTTFEAKV